MKARIEEIRIQNFRALENVRLRVGDLTFLVGRNGAGKSSILDAIEFMREALTEGVRTALDRRDGFWGVHRRGAAKDSPIGLAVAFRVERERRRHVSVLYGFQLAWSPETNQHGELHLREALKVSSKADPPFFERNGTEFKSNQGVMIPATAGEYLVFNLIARVHDVWSDIHDALTRMRGYNLNPSLLRIAAPVGPMGHLAKDGANAGDVLDFLQNYMRDEYRWLVKHVASVTSGIKSISTLTERGRRVISFQQEPHVSPGEPFFDASQMSDGTLRAVGVLLALCQQPQPSLLLIDEIEGSVHPGALESLLEAAEEKIERFPVVLTTHSPEVLGTKQVTPDRVRILQWSQGMSRLYPLSAGTKKSVDSVTTVGDLLRYNALWPDDSPETFTGDILEL